MYRRYGGEGGLMSQCVDIRTFSTHTRFFKISNFLKCLKNRNILIFNLNKKITIKYPYKLNCEIIFEKQIKTQVKTLLR